MQKLLKTYLFITNTITHIHTLYIYIYIYPAAHKYNSTLTLFLQRSDAHTKVTSLYVIYPPDNGPKSDRKYLGNN